MNKLTLIGRLGADPETKKVRETSVTKFSVATTERYKNRNGEKVEDTTWHNCEAWGKQGEIIAQYLTKGSQIALVGKQEHKKHEDKYYASVKVQEFEFVGGTKTEGSPAPAPAAKSEPAPEPKKNEVGGDGLPF